MLVPGRPLDLAVSKLVLQSLQPPSLECVRAAWRSRQEADGGEEQRRRAELANARGAVEEAKLRFFAVDPRNRLVAAVCEERLELAQRELQWLEQRAKTEGADHKSAFSEAAWAELLALSEDVEAIWNAPTTKHRDRKEIVRTLVDSVVIERRTDEMVVATVHRADGEPDTRVEAKLMGYRARLIRELAASGVTPAEIANTLNREGLQTLKGRPWAARTVVRWIPNPGATNSRLAAVGGDRS